ncbi:MAG: S46 family peptidase [Bacteroidota bacterium]
MKITLRWITRILLVGAVLFISNDTIFSVPDEGMWTFDNPPFKQLKDRYNFTPTQEWLDHIRLSSVRFNDGGSGSFISPTGLVLTNHHVALDQLQKVSTPEKDYVHDGFYAATTAEELRCPDLELNVLMSFENITDRIFSVIKKGMSDQEVYDARKAEIAKIEKESLEKTKLRSDVVSLYDGGEYWLYRYKKYTDVRLIFAPEQQIAFFGGDPDNFTYPRYDLDMAIFRVYENNKPVESTHYLKWNPKGAADGELVFVSGHPGSTSRLNTMAEIEKERDYLYPLRLKTLKRRLDVLKRYATLGTEQARQAGNMIFYIENAIKAFTGEYNGLLDKNLIAKKQTEENDFQTRVNSKPEWKSEFGGVWDTIAETQKKHIEKMNITRYRAIRGSRLALMAMDIVWYVTEIQKPDGKRLEGFHDSQLESLRYDLLSPAPFYPVLEETIFADVLRESLEQLGLDDPFIKTVLGTWLPEEVAKELFTNTKLADPAVRKALIEGGEKAVAESTDPLIALMRKADPVLRELRKWVEDNIDSQMKIAGEKLGKARFAIYGKSVNPDATFTLRLSYGTVKGYPMNGTIAPSKTTFYGLYDRASSFDMKQPFDLPARYLDRKEKLDLSTPLNFVSSCDVIGGNSGSPVIDRNGELVGLIFDGNIESLIGNFIYSDETNRAVAVHSAAMIEALRKLYDAGKLANEIEGKSK